MIGHWTCLEYHRPIITNACPPKQSQKSLHQKLVPIRLRVSEVGNRQIITESRYPRFGSLSDKNTKNGPR